MMEHMVHEGCAPTGPIITHAMDCEDDELEECQKVCYAERLNDYSNLSNLVKNYQTLLASSSDKRQPTPSSKTSSQPTVCSPAIKPVDINSLLESENSQCQTIVVSSSPVASTSTSGGQMWLDGGAVQMINGKPVRFQFVSVPSRAPSLATNQVRVAAPSSGTTTVRLAIPMNNPLLPAPAVSSYASPSHTTHQLPHQMTGSEALGNSQPPPAEPVASQITIVAHNQMQSPPVRALHNLPQQLNIPVHAQPLPPPLQMKSTITRPQARQSYLSGRITYPVQSLPNYQSKPLSNSGTVTGAVIAPTSSVSHPQKPLPPPSNQSASGNGGCSQTQDPEQRPVVTKPLITYGPASSSSAPLVVQVPVPPSSLVNKTPPSESAVPKSLPLLPCSIPEQNQKQRHSNPADRAAPSSGLVDLTNEEGLALIPNMLDNTASGKRVDNKIFPSLVVVARPSLNKFSASTINSERQAFDAEIRKMLACPGRQFIKRLFRLGLLLSVQQCSHGNSMVFREPPVWGANCCPDKSVFANSLFEGSSLSPVGVIKLLYHWACNTNVQNVIYWVKVDNVVVKTYYTIFRAVCTTIVQEKIGLLGGANKPVQIGVISLGTTTEENGQKEVKLDILAALDDEKKIVRLKALDNSEIMKDWEDSTVYKYKFRRIAENLKTWVDPNSVIILDFAVDYGVFRENGFLNVVMSGSVPSLSNAYIMSYLRKTIPQMFQTTLSLLTVNIIQQFLDELVWREFWGTTPSVAYENLIKHIAEIMGLKGPPIMEKLKLISQNPSSDWKFSVWENKKFSKLKSSAPDLKLSKEKSSNAPASNKKPGSRNRRKPPAASSCSQTNALLTEKSPAPPKPPAVSPPQTLQQLLTQNVPLKNNTKAARQISLELYYYGFIKGNLVSDQQQTSFSILCVFCSALISSSTDLTEHLIAHALDASYSWYMIPCMKKICWHCFDVVTDMQIHVASKHPQPPNTPTSCKICALDFQESVPLIEHMTETHAELDMPYQCEICNFRTSLFEEITPHFRSSHESQPCAVCPYCLKVVRLTSSPYLDPRQAGLQNYFVQHIQKHRIESLNKKCEKCVLSFINHDSLKSHQDSLHGSCKGMPNLTRYKILPSKVVMMDRPTQPPLPPITATESNFHTLQGKTLPLPQFTLHPEILSLNCLECDSPISESHFTLKLKCAKCAFTSHCANAIREHSTRAHADKNLAIQRTGGIPMQSSVNGCSKCNYRSNDGNKTADHVAACGSYAVVGVAQKRNLPHKVNPKKKR